MQDQLESESLQRATSCHTKLPTAMLGVLCSRTLCSVQACSFACRTAQDPEP